MRKTLAGILAALMVLSMGTTVFAANSPDKNADLNTDAAELMKDVTVIPDEKSAALMQLTQTTVSTSDLEEAYDAVDKNAGVGCEMLAAVELSNNKTALPDGGIIIKFKSSSISKSDASSIRIYHKIGTAWQIVTPNVANGYVVARFTSLSPFFVLKYSGTPTTKDNSENHTSVTGTFNEEDAAEVIVSNTGTDTEPDPEPDPDDTETTPGTTPDPDDTETTPGRVPSGVTNVTNNTTNSTTNNNTSNTTNNTTNVMDSSTNNYHQSSDSTDNSTTNNYYQTTQNNNTTYSYTNTNNNTTNTVTDANNTTTTNSTNSNNSTSSSSTGSNNASSNSSTSSNTNNSIPGGTAGQGIALPGSTVVVSGDSGVKPSAGGTATDPGAKPSAGGTATDSGAKPSATDTTDPAKQPQSSSAVNNPGNGSWSDNSSTNTNDNSSTNTQTVTVNVTTASGGSDSSGSGSGSVKAGVTTSKTSPQTGSSVPALPMIAVFAVMGIAVCGKKARNL
jgi:hypothetical protein